MRRNGIIISIFALCMIGGALMVFLITSILNDSNYMGVSRWWNRLELVNTVTLPEEEIENIDITYLSDHITFYKGEDEQFIMKEYMNIQDEDLFATVIQDGNSIVVKGGSSQVRKFRKRLRTAISIYLPKSYDGSLLVSVSSGSINSEEHFTLTMADLESKSGSIRMESITAAQDITVRSSSGSLSMGTLITDGACNITAKSGSIRADSITAADLTMSTSSGSIRVEEASGSINASSSSGSISMQDTTGVMKVQSNSGSIQVQGSGSGLFEASSGSVNVELEQVTGDISLKANSGDIRLLLPYELSFKLEADTTSGNIDTDFDDQLSFNKKGNSAKGQVGSNPSTRIKLTASSGNVKVSR